MEDVSLEEITSAMKKRKSGKPFTLSKVSTEMINASAKVRIYVMMNFFRVYFMEKECQKIGRLVC